MTKNEYRQFFANVRPFLNMKSFLDLAEIKSPCFSRFMKGEGWDYEISHEKLNTLYFCIIDFCEKIA